jgi:MoxR-like ATPase
VLADRLLQLLRVEREYVQLHRDTTVQSLTLAPSLAAGVIVYEDSPLVRALTWGRCLVIDEVDKAPLEVVVVLKGLLEDKEMTLCDGRRVLSAATASQNAAGRKVLPIHPNFRVIALANRPGFPFLGNNFFSRLGDCFASHVVQVTCWPSSLAARV